MAFLDNSGDIILDAVLTDLGRQRLAEGSFSIAKFALGDEEINYGLYNGTHAQGSAYYDLDILQTPVLEAFTSDQSLMKSRLITLTRNNILYMPILKLNNSYPACQPDGAKGFQIMADSTTFNVNGNATAEAPAASYLHGVPRNNSSVTTHICIDQGINSVANAPLTIAQDLDRSLMETSYLVKLDSRLMTLDAYLNTDNTPRLEPQYLDDDSIATYLIVAGQGDGGGAILGPRAEFSPRRRHQLTPATPAGGENGISEIDNYEVFNGPLGSILRITPRASNLIQQSTSLFDELGNSGTSLSFRGATINTYKYIDTTINVTGVTTGNSIDIPVRIIKGLTFS